MKHTIDVLAILDREIEAIRNTKQILYYSLSPERQRDYAEQLESLIESRAAVAGLMEEALHVLAWISDYVPDGVGGREAEQRELRDALTRCRGGAK